MRILLRTCPWVVMFRKCAGFDGAWYRVVEGLPPRPPRRTSSPCRRQADPDWSRVIAEGIVGPRTHIVFKVAVILFPRTGASTASQ